MAFEDAPQTEHAYPYWAGWHVVGCAILFFGLLGSIAVTLLPAGYERVQTGDLPTGIAMMVMGLFGIPTLAMSFLSLAAGIRGATLAKVDGGHMANMEDSRGTNDAIVELAARL